MIARIGDDHFLPEKKNRAKNFPFLDHGTTDTHSPSKIWLIFLFAFQVCETRYGSGLPKPNTGRDEPKTGPLSVNCPRKKEPLEVRYPVASGTGSMAIPRRLASHFGCAAKEDEQRDRQKGGEGQRIRKYGSRCRASPLRTVADHALGIIATPSLHLLAHTAVVFDEEIDRKQRGYARISRLMGIRAMTGQSGRAKGECVCRG